MTLPLSYTRVYWWEIAPMVIERLSIIPMRRGIAVIGLIAAVNALSFLQQMPDHDLTGWDARVLRNWDQYGYGALHGRVVINPGGIRPGEKVQVYPGYRGFSLLPLYVLYSTTGSLWYSRLVFLVLLSTALSLSIWWMLDLSATGLVAAAALCMSPGFVRWGIAWDPVPGSVLFGVPVIMGLVHVANPDTHPKSPLLLAAGTLLTVLYAQTEWGAVFALFIGWWALLVMLWRGHRLRLGLVTMALLIGVQLGTILLMRQKLGHDPSSHGFRELVAYYREYNFGKGGYGKGQITWPLALKRLAVVWSVGLAPLWIVIALIVGHTWPRRRSAVALRLLPLAAAVLTGLAMRNSMAEHQWISCSFVGLGILVSLQLLWQVTPDNSTEPTARLTTESPWFLVVLLVFTTAYGRIIGGINCVKDARVNALISLVDNHTPRSATVCLGRDLEGQFSVDRRPMLDRHLCSLSTGLENGAGQPSFIVDSKAMPDYGVLVATAKSRDDPLWTRLLGWYTEHVTQRKQAEFLQSDQYFLYKRAPAAQSPLPSSK
jgi:hypothetical protein